MTRCDLLSLIGTPRYSVTDFSPLLLSFPPKGPSLQFQFTSRQSYLLAKYHHDTRQARDCLRLVSQPTSLTAIYISNTPTPTLQTLTRSPQTPGTPWNPLTQCSIANTHTSCGSTAGKDPVHLEAARTLAYEFHKNNVQLVYGGGTTGLMGEIAKTLVSLSGPQAVHGIIPRALVKISTVTAEHSVANGNTNSGEGKAAERVISENEENGIPESEYGMTTIVPDMHTRKRMMATKVLEGGPGSGFVSLAGGFGTIEEVMEMTTWNQLGIHRVGVVLLNINGYWDGLLGWVKNAVSEGFISGENGSILCEAKDPTEVWPKLLAYQCSCDRMQLNWGEE